MNRLTIEIKGKKYKLTTEENEDYIKSVENEVNSAIDKVKSAGMIQDNDAILLVLLNYVDKLRKSKTEISDIENKLQAYMNECEAMRSEMLRMSASLSEKREKEAAEFFVNEEMSAEEEVTHSSAKPESHTKTVMERLISGDKSASEKYASNAENALKGQLTMAEVMKDKWKIN